jgi:hypothetical protein
LTFNQDVVNIPRFLIHKLDESQLVKQAYIHRDQAAFIWQGNDIVLVVWLKAGTRLSLSTKVGFQYAPLGKMAVQASSRILAYTVTGNPA